MKNLILLFIALCWFDGFGQTNEYKKILAEKRTISAGAYYAKLKAFQQKYTQFSNVYFQLGESELEFFTEFDPIVNRSGSRHYIYNAKINFGLSKGFLNAEEAAKTPGWYKVPAFKNKDSLKSMINTQVDQKYKSVISYSEAYEQLIDHYDRAVDFYLKAQQKFIGINTKHENLRELFLAVNDSLKTEVGAVGQNFDSCLYHLEQYRNAYQKLPHKKKRKVKLNFQEIQHFRMNGITPSNFLADEIDIWDYGKWSANFAALLDEEVNGLKREIEVAYKSFLSINEKMMVEDECLQINVDSLKFQRIINLVTKYDNESVLIEVFTYLANKLKYGNQIVYERNCNIIESLPTDDILSRKVRTYKNIHSELQKTDSIAQLIASTSKTNVNFRWFFDEYMPGSDGHVTFSKQQIEENDAVFAKELNGLIELMNSQYLMIDSTNVCYQAQDSVLTLEPTITDSATCLLKQISISGDSIVAILAKNGTYSVAGLKAKIVDYEVLWEHPAQSSIDFFKILTDSSFVYGGNSEKPWLTHVSTSGTEKASISLSENDTIRNVYYNGLLGLYTIVSGFEQDESGGGYSLYIAGRDGKIKSSKQLPIQGKFISLFVNEQNYWVFSERQGESGLIITANVFDNVLQKVNEPINYTFSNDMITPRVIKNDNKDITVIGNSKETESGLIYSLIDYEGNIQYETNFK